MTISQGRLNCYFFSLIIIFATLSGCSSHAAKMIHPQSGSTADCSASGVGFGAGFSASFVENCRRTYEDRGYVRMDNLTPEQRASLARRGLLP
jgi:hypothetical protein